jgi:hypothetical protein
VERQILSRKTPYIDYDLLMAREPKSPARQALLWIIAIALVIVAIVWYRR